MNTRLFLIHPERFYLQVIPRLRNLGCEVGLIIAGKGRRKLFEAVAPGATVISSAEAHGAALPDGEPTRPANHMQVSQLAPYSGSAYLLMDRKNLYKHRLTHLHRRYLDYIGFWSVLLERDPPNAVIFHGWPHMGYDHVLYWLCKAQGIETRVVDPTGFDDRIRLVESEADIVGPSRSELDSYLLGDIGSGERRDAEVARLDSPALEAINREHNDMRAIKRNLSLWTMAHAMLNRQTLHPLKRLPDPMYGFTDGSPRQARYLARSLMGRIRDRRLLRLYQSLCSSTVAGEPYVYLALHYQPESSTLPEGGVLFDQTHIAETLLAGLPKGWRLYVREHPRQFRRSHYSGQWRSAGFYRRLADHPAVRLMSLETSAPELIRNARAVATVTGTTGWEAARVGTPALVFANPWYATCPGVQLVRTSEDCAKVLMSIASFKTRVDVGEVRAWAKLMRAKYWIPAAFTDRLVELSGLTEEDNAEAYTAALYDRVPIAAREG